MEREPRGFRPVHDPEYAQRTAPHAVYAEFKR